MGAWSRTGLEATIIMSLDGKNSTAPEKTLKKHVFLGLKKNTKKHQGAGGGGGVDW